MQNFQKLYHRQYRMIIYIHGLDSNPNADKALQLKKYFGDKDILTMSLEYDSSKLETAIDDLNGQLEAINTEHNLHGQFMLVGTSLGGYFASQLSNIWKCKKVLLNPCLFPSKMLSLGERTIYKTGQTYLLTKETVAAISANENEILKDSTYCFLQMGDAVLDNNLNKNIFKHTFIQEGGNHRFENFESILPKIEDFYSL